MTTTPGLISDYSRTRASSAAVSKRNKALAANAAERRKLSDRVKAWKSSKLLSTPWPALTYQTQRRRLLVEQDYKCARCALAEWHVQKLPLERENKDGNRNNNARDNVEMICPNCHAITPTWRRNKTKRDYFGRDTGRGGYADGCKPSLGQFDSGGVFQ